MSRRERKDPYELLGVKSTAGLEDIKRAYRRRAMALHPDRNPSASASGSDAHREFNELTEAYNLLSDPTRRREYDGGLKTWWRQFMKGLRSGEESAREAGKTAAKSPAASPSAAASSGPSSGPSGRPAQTDARPESRSDSRPGFASREDTEESARARLKKNESLAKPPVNSRPPEPPLQRPANRPVDGDETPMSTPYESAGFASQRPPERQQDRPSEKPAQQQAQQQVQPPVQPRPPLGEAPRPSGAERHPSEPVKTPESASRAEPAQPAEPARPAEQARPAASRPSAPMGGGKPGEVRAIEVDVPFLTAIRGGHFVTAVSIESVCPECAGAGAAPGSTGPVCPDCGGEGRLVSSTSESPVKCPRCLGRGRLATVACAKCGGAGFRRRAARLDLQIPPLSRDGDRLSVPEEDGLTVILRVAKHPDFQRRDRDILTVRSINLAQAVYGDTIEVATLDGTVAVELPPGTASGSVVRLAGYGLPDPDGNGADDDANGGHQYILIDVELPILKHKTASKRFHSMAKSCGLLDDMKVLPPDPGPARAKKAKKVASE